MDQLPQADRAELERILLKEPFEMTDAEVAFLRARRSYLTFPQKEAYKDVLELSEEELAPSVQPQVPHQQTQYTDPNAGAEQAQTQTEQPQTPADEVKEDVEGLKASEDATDTGNGQSEDANPYGVDAQEAEKLAE